MRKRFLVGSIIFLGLIIFLLVTFSIFTSRSHAADCETSVCDEGVCAGARISGGLELIAKGTVRSPSNCWGGWGINVRAGTNSDSDSDYYSGGTRQNLSVSQRTDQATATAWITGYNRHDGSYYAYACDRSGFDN